MKLKLPLFRYTLQVISLVSFVFLLTCLTYPLGSENQLLQWFSWFDPWLLLSHLRWQQEIPSWVELPLLILMATLVWGRVFCGWVCPFGAFLMLIDKMGRLFFKAVPVIRIKGLYFIQPVRYYWLFFLVIVFGLGSNWVLFFTPFVLLSHEIIRTLQGDVPWALAGISVATLMFSRLWCSVLCPTGVLLSAVARLRLFRYQIAGKCVHCEQCAQACSVGAAVAASGIAKDGCLACGDCGRVCPTKSIKWRPATRNDSKVEAAPPDEVAATSHPSSRRQFLQAAFAAVMAVALWQKTVTAAKKVLRPPGALTETQFTAVCNRCGRCVMVCPGKALRPMTLSDGIANFETPYIIPRKNRCDLCLACQEVCPTGAIAKVPLERVRMGQASIDKKRCIAWNENKMCLICGEQCPVAAIEADEQHRPAVLTEKCAGCGSCENGCPVAGEAAIRVLPK
ncbi:4Fe-4S dicluster domain-containing protein [Sporomusa aerivorans]|uniref:4Fe-4S dicluster domain-containing protein n=1 Tax=Sporomusa aerivorans TaxID=204936 RepID=UPI00352A8353